MCLIFLTTGIFFCTTGHMGPNVYPGCGRVRNGQMKYLKRVSRVECNDPLV